MDFYEFCEIMKNIPTFDEIDELCKSNDNLSFLDKLASHGYFKLLSPIQKYDLFRTACVYESIDIAILLFNNDMDMEGVKELMINFMGELGSNSEYVIFRWIWDKKIINFTKDEIYECFIKILKSGNLEFVEWFSSQLNLIDWNNNELRNKIAIEVLEKANSKQDYIIAKFIVEQYMKIKLTSSI